MRVVLTSLILAFCIFTCKPTLDFSDKDKLMESVPKVQAQLSSVEDQEIILIVAAEYYLYLAMIENAPTEEQAVLRDIIESQFPYKNKSAEEIVTIYKRLHPDDRKSK